MPEFSTSLLREKFVIRDTSAPDEVPLVALSNRIILKHQDESGRLVETLVVRAQNSHSCARFASRIYQSFLRSGPVLNRAEPFDWAAAWESVVEDHERRFNPENWGAVYSNGRPVFGMGAYHRFLDVIEQCDARAQHNYDLSVRIAEQAFTQAGKTVSIEHDSSIALAVTLAKGTGRLGVMFRGATRTSTFNVAVEDKAGQKVTAPQLMALGAAFLEGIHLSFHVGMANERIKQGLIPRYGEEGQRAELARRRLARLNAEVKTFENLLKIRYRPERPDFFQNVMDAEKLARSLYDEDEPLPEEP